MKYKIKFEAKVECIREVEVENDKQAEQIAEKIADGLVLDDFYLDQADINVVDIKITKEIK